MTNQRNMKRGRKGPLFIMVENPLFDSEAFNSLSHSAVRVFLSIIRHKNPTKGMAGSLSEPIFCPYTDMNGGMARATIAKAIRELEEKGFIERTQRGGLYKRPNLYAFSGEWINWKKQNTSSETEHHRCRN